MYNDLGGTEESFLVWNLINGFAFAAYSSGATRLTIGRMPASFNTVGYQWLAVVGIFMCTTRQLQTLKGQESDCARQRIMVPSVLGDLAAKWTNAVLVLVWSHME